MLPWRAELTRQIVEEERTSLELEEELTRQVVDELEAEITDEQAALQQLVDEVLWEDGAHDGAGTKYGKLQKQYQMLMSRFGRETQNLVRFQSEPPFAPSYAPGTRAACLRMPPTLPGTRRTPRIGAAILRAASTLAPKQVATTARALSVRMDPTRPSVACNACKARGELPAELPAARAYAARRV
jgi:hypothetical protein